MGKNRYAVGDKKGVERKTGSHGQFFDKKSGACVVRDGLLT